MPERIIDLESAGVKIMQARALLTEIITGFDCEDHDMLMLIELAQDVVLDVENYFKEQKII